MLVVGKTLVWYEAAKAGFLSESDVLSLHEQGVYLVYLVQLIIDVFPSRQVSIPRPAGSEARRDADVRQNRRQREAESSVDEEDGDAPECPAESSAGDEAESSEDVEDGDASAHEGATQGGALRNRTW